MQLLSNIALKEWAVICQALALGRQRVLFRKGGIHEGPEGFRPEHDQFWLFPTGFHQSPEGIRPEFADLVDPVQAQPAVAGMIPIQHFCRVESVQWIDDLERLAPLAPEHVLTAEAISARFHYRRPGLFVLTVETRSLPAPVLIPADPRYDGCRSWVTLNDELSTRDLSPPVGGPTSLF